jgi:hypothetical protein
MILTIILLSLAGIMTAVMDRHSTAGEFYLSVFRSFRSKWWGPRTHTWRNKHNSPLPFSSSILVFLTDSWHFFKEIQLLCIYIALALNLSLVNYLPIGSFEAVNDYPLVRLLLDVLLYKAIMAGSFHIFYTNLLSMNFWKRLQNYMYEMNFGKAVIVVLPLFFFWIGAAEALNLLDPRYSSTDGDTTFLGDIIMSITFLVTLGALAWMNFRKKKEGGQEND